MFENYTVKELLLENTSAELRSMATGAFLCYSRDEKVFIVGAPFGEGVDEYPDFDSALQKYLRYLEC